MRLVATTSANKPSIAINASQRAIRARITPCMARSPRASPPPGGHAPIPSISGGEIGTRMRICTDRLMTRPGRNAAQSLCGRNRAVHRPAHVAGGGWMVLVFGRVVLISMRRNLSKKRNRRGHDPLEAPQSSFGKGVNVTGPAHRARKGECHGYERQANVRSCECGRAPGHAGSSA
jgi:hypothetical protein